jgi:hypothetical protein
MGYGADQLGNAAELTNGFQAAFIGAAGVAVAAALAALTLFSTRSAAASDAEVGEPSDEAREAVAA